MKKKFYLSVLTCVLVAVFWVGPGMGQTDAGTGDADADAIEFYYTVIDGAIEKCQAKSALLDSGSYHIRRIAVRAALKSAYFEAHKDELVAYLVANEVRLNPARVHYHLNRQFYNKVRTNDVYAEVQVNRAMID